MLCAARALIGKVRYAALIFKKVYEYMVTLLVGGMDDADLRSKIHRRKLGKNDAKNDDLNQKVQLYSTEQEEVATFLE